MGESEDVLLLGADDFRFCSRERMRALAVVLLWWNRYDSLPVSTMWQWCVRRSSRAVVIFASPNTLAHSAKGTLEGKQGGGQLGKRGTIAQGTGLALD